MKPLDFILFCLYNEIRLNKLTKKFALYKYLKNCFV